MNSKLGIIAIEWQTEAMLWAIENKPTAMEFMMVQPLDTRPMEEIRPRVKVSQVELMQMLVEASPKTLLIIRAYPDDMGHPDFEERMKRWSEPFRQVSDRVVAHSVNEPVVFNPDMAKRLNEYEIGFIQRMSAEGLIPMCFCLSESHLTGPTLRENGTIEDWGNLPLWWYMKDGMKHLAELGGFWGPNEYDWKSWCASRHRGWKWRLGHWEVNLDVLKRHLKPSEIPMIGIGEGILDGKIWTSRLPQDDPRCNKPWGWQYAKSSIQHLADIKGIYADSYHNPRVAFHLMFAWAPNHRDWRTYDVSRMKDLLAQYLRENPPIYWESNGGNNMDIWKNVPPEIVQWRKVVEEVTSSHHVPIPAVNDVHVSPAKLLACMIMRESEGKQFAKNPITGAAGLLQIMPFHFDDGQDPYEPKWNVKRGLELLEAKLSLAPGDLQRALFYYSGRLNRPWEPFIEKYWNYIVKKYKEFWGIDLEPAPDWEAKYKELQRIIDEVKGLTVQIQLDLDEMVDNNLKELSRMAKAINRLLE